MPAVVSEVSEENYREAIDRTIAIGNMVPGKRDTICRD